MSDIEIIQVTKNNIDQYPPKCFLNPKHPGYFVKKTWMEQQVSNGLTIKNLINKEDNKIIGFIEYISGENAWRAVNAPNYLFIHCIWISPNKYKNLGYGSQLINDVLSDASNQNKNGVAVVTSEGPFMASKAIFENNNFTSTDYSPPSYELMTKPLKQGQTPSFKNWQQQLTQYQGLHIIYSNQCPWIARSIQEIKDYQQKHNLSIQYTELKTPKDAQNAPSPYSAFNLIINGKLIVDHYISIRRLKNILKKNYIK
jgi:ribosomal protein S18 acetylase RimI-like enzyme